MEQLSIIFNHVSVLFNPAQIGYLWFRSLWFVVPMHGRPYHGQLIPKEDILDSKMFYSTN